MTEESTDRPPAGVRANLNRAQELKWFLYSHREQLLEGILLVAILAIGASQMATLEDLTVADEAGYLRGGLVLTPRSYSYSYLYALAGILSQNLVTTYLIGRSLGVVIFVLGAWFAGRLLGSRVAALTGALLLISLGSPYIWPGIATFAAGVNIAASAILLKWQNARGAAAASVLMWIGAASRPEYWPAAALCTVLAGWTILREAKSNAAKPSWVAVLLLAVVPLLLIGGGAIELGGERTWLAFGQHYAVAHEGDSYWVGWEEIIRRDFGDASNVGSAFAAAPGAVIDHVRINLTRTPAMIRDSLLWGRNTRPGLALSNRSALVLLTALLVAGLATAAAEVWKGHLHRLSWSFAPLAWPVYLIALLSIPPVLILFPRLHYLQTWVAAAILTAVIVMSRMSARMQLGIAAVAITLVAVPLMVSVVHSYTRPAYRENLALVRVLQRLPGKHVAATGLSPELSTYIPNFRMVRPKSTDETFQDFLHREDVDVIVADQALLAGAWSDVPGFTDFDPAAAGFRLATTVPRNIFVLVSPTE
ncbi:MAG: hypothetical protein CVT60_05105 [Actinobacteria bacterium HGW-Actinobacteria-10]|nr:MAG: hypothetical protein CVT60_05105 [Actinobacteria bacterium HGW-Actinobacteria-10]